MGNDNKNVKNVNGTAEIFNDLDNFEVAAETLALMASGRLGDAAEDRDDLDVALICASRELERARARLSDLRRLVPYLAERRALLIDDRTIWATTSKYAIEEERAFLREMLALLASPTGGA